MVEQPTQPLMPLLRALRRHKLRVSIHGDSARVWPGRDEAQAVEAWDLVSSYASGKLALDGLVAEVLRRLGRGPTA